MKAKFTINQIGKSFQSNSPAAITLQNTKHYGERKAKNIVYSIYEAIYLSEKNKVEILKNNKIIKPESLLKTKEIKLNYTVFKDLRDKGSIPKAGLKFGADFRIYQKGNNPKKGHADYLLYSLEEKERVKMQDIAGKTRISHSTRKALLIAVVDSQEDVTYYILNWKKI